MGQIMTPLVLHLSNGRHLAMMPHPERGIYPENWAHYPEDRIDEITPWILMFLDAKDWIILAKESENA